MFTESINLHIITSSKRDKSTCGSYKHLEHRKLEAEVFRDITKPPYLLKIVDSFQLKLKASLMKKLRAGEKRLQNITK